MQVQLFVELLNHYLYFMEKGNEEITASIVNQVVSKIKEELPSLEPNEERDQITKHFENTKDHIKAAVSSKPTFKDIQIED